MVNKKFNKGFKLENYDTHFSLCTQKWFLIIVVILTLLLIIKKSNRFQNINNLTVERLLLFFILEYTVTESNTVWLLKYAIAIKVQSDDSKSANINKPLAIRKTNSFLLIHLFINVSKFFLLITKIILYIIFVLLLLVGISHQLGHLSFV